MLQERENTNVRHVQFGDRQRQEFKEFSPSLTQADEGDVLFRQAMRGWLKELNLAQDAFARKCVEEARWLIEQGKLTEDAANRMGVLGLNQVKISKLLNGTASHNRSIVIIWIRVMLNHMISQEYSEYVQKCKDTGIERPLPFTEEDGKTLMALAGYSNSTQLENATTTAQQRVVKLTKTPSERYIFRNPPKVTRPTSNQFRWKLRGKAHAQDPWIGAQGSLELKGYIIKLGIPVKYHYPTCKGACKRLLVDELVVSMTPNRQHLAEEIKHFCYHDSPIPLELVLE